ncbi:hypothetical protein [Botrimarina sp.]|uniref:hypothetical protein n=1 Tax=Botrimarina sp. TaxID=2795802 RepID=UPI0032EAAC45
MLSSRQTADATIRAAIEKKVKQVKDEQPTLRHNEAWLKAKKWAVAKFGYAPVAKIFGLPPAEE